MNKYSVKLYKILQNDTGHNFKCLQKQFQISSWDPTEALVAAQQEKDARLWEADCIEIVYEPQRSRDLGVAR